MQSGQQEENSVNTKIRRLKVTCVNAKYGQYIQKLYPELIVVPFRTALKYKKNIDAFITVKGRGAFIAPFFKAARLEYQGRRVQTSGESRHFVHFGKNRVVYRRPFSVRLGGMCESNARFA